jgi:hypothetical protein
LLTLDGDDIVEVDDTPPEVAGTATLPTSPARAELPPPNMPKAKISKTQTKSDFVRSLPNTMSAPEVVKKAKAAGIKLSTQLVYVVRGRATGKGKTKKASAPTTSAATKPAKSKAAFVRGLPASTPAKDVVKLAKAAGIKLAVDYVYNVRGADKAKRKRKRAAAMAVTSPPTSTNGARSSGNSNAENLLKAIGAELGLGKAIEILSGERARVAAVIGG